MWLKLSDDFGVDCARVGLSDAAFRTHTEALLWIMSRENGPMIDSRICAASPRLLSQLAPWPSSSRLAIGSPSVTGGTSCTR